MNVRILALLLACAALCTAQSSEKEEKSNTAGALAAR